MMVGSGCGCGIEMSSSSPWLGLRVVGGELLKLHYFYWPDGQDQMDIELMRLLVE